MTDQPDQHGSQLTPDDAAALDWLEHTGWSDEPSPQHLRDRVERLRAFRDLIAEGEPATDAALVQAVCARLGLSDADAVGAAEYRLAEEDADALDLWLLEGRRANRTPTGLRDRARMHDRLSELLREPASDDWGDAALVERTLAAIARRAPLEPVEPRRLGIGARLSDLVSLAAVLLIGASVLMPVLTTVRAESRRVANEANMAVAGLGFGAYAADYDGRLPALVAPPTTGPRVWWRVGVDPQQSNSANLYRLYKLDYTTLESLASPGNPDAPRDDLPESAEDWRSYREVSYSYRLSDEPEPMLAGDTVVLADRSPVAVRLFRGETVLSGENSPNHGGRGQHLLRGDGSVSWADSPWVGGDHLYLPRAIERIIDALPAGRVISFPAMPDASGPDDAFVAP
ncbi:MAG: hypothetical protein ACTS22_04620 [Phycisphaerales bacterium]